MKSSGERLEEARVLRNWSINLLHKTLDARGVRGSSYGSVRNYLSGKSEPPLEFLLAAAEALQVNANYLAYGKEHLTKARAKAAQVAEDAESGLKEELERVGLNQAGRDLKKAVLRETGGLQPSPWNVPPVFESEEVKQWMASGELNEADLALLRETDGLLSVTKDLLERTELIKEYHAPYWLAPLAEVWRQLEEAQDNPFRDQGIDLLQVGEPIEVRIAKALAAPLEALGVDGKELHRSGFFGHYVLDAIPGLLILARAYTRQCLMKAQERDIDDGAPSTPDPEE